MNLNKTYVCDFETTTKEDDCRVWAWGSYNIGKDSFIYGKDIKSFFDYIFSLENSTTIFFHNLKFDGEFMFYYLFRNGFKHSEEQKLYNKEFSSLITFMNVFYAINIMNNNKKYYIYDSLKIMPIAVEQISKAFNLSQFKGEIDYHKDRPIGYEMDKHEIAYLKNDVEIVGKALLYFFDQKLTEITQASNAFNDFNKIIGSKNFTRWFPKNDYDSEIRQSYRGGFTYVNPKFKNKTIDQKGLVFDVNSLYPSVMYNCNLPYGEPILYRGKYQEDKLYNLYIQMFRCNFELKKDHIPTIQLKNGYNFKFNPTEYVTSSNGDDVTMCMTNVDLELFLKHYDVYNLEYFRGWKFKSTNMIFKEYIDKWIDIKNQATLDKNNGLRTIAKLMLNSLYGKFAINPLVKSKMPTFDGELIHYVNGKETTRNPIYVAVASFITAYARNITISSAQANFNRFIYADTDSLHLVGEDIPLGLEIDNVKLGAWKLEGEFDKAKFLRAKSYIERIDNQLHVTCAGMPKTCHENINFDNFKSGVKVDGKLQQKRVKGGVILKDVEFTIKL
jgi:hypothetical protein